MLDGYSTGEGRYCRAPEAIARNVVSHIPVPNRLVSCDHESPFLIRLPCKNRGRSIVDKFYGTRFAGHPQAAN